MAQVAAAGRWVRQQMDPMATARTQATLRTSPLHPHRVCTRARHRPHSAFQLAHCPPTRLDPAPHRSTRPRLACRTATPRWTTRRERTSPTAWPSSKRSRLGERSVPLATSLSPEPSTRPYRHGFNTQRSLNNPTQNTRRPHPLGGRSDTAAVTLAEKGWAMDRDRTLPSPSSSHTHTPLPPCSVQLPCSRPRRQETRRG